MINRKNVIILIMLVVGAILLFGYFRPDREANLIEGNVITSERSITVALYGYNPNLDKDDAGNVLCTENGLIGTPTQINIDGAATEEGKIRATVLKLISNDFSQESLGLGLTSEFPIDRLNLVDLTFESGVVTLTFDDPNNLTSGGSCRVAIMRGQIENTVMQFEGVESVIILPEDIFQP